MVYIREEYRIEEIDNVLSFFSVLPPKFHHAVVRKTYLPWLPGYECVEIWNNLTNDFLGEWDEDSFDFAGANDAVIDTLDRHFRLHFSLHRKAK